jgi:DNA transposition AAA+ family ATPase
MKKIIDLDEACKKCGHYKGIINKNGPHIKLSCDYCGSYIKFISKNEYNALIIDNEEQKNQTDDDIMNEINFKLDLILDHLGIRETL